MDAPTLHWYALKVFYNKVFDMEDLLGDMGIDSYIAVEKQPLKGEAYLLARKRIASLQAMGKSDRRYVQEGVQIFQRVPLVSSLMFFRAEVSALADVAAALKNSDDSYKGFIYKTADWKEFAVVPDAQMEAFRLVTSQGADGLEFFSDEDITRFREGHKVRVTDGPFKGAEGYIKRIRRDRRLLVSIEGIVAVATAHIPPEMLETVED